MTLTMEPSTNAYEGESELCFEQYKRDTKDFLLLDEEQERKLAYRIQAGLQIDKVAWLEDGKIHKKEIVHLTEDAQAASDMLCCCNCRLVVGVARKYMHHGLPLMDLIEEGNVGLIKAAYKYDPAIARFSTHATWWIKQAIGRAVNERGKAIRIPSHAATAINKVSRIATRLATSLGYEPTVEQIAEAAHMTVEAVSRTLYDKETVRIPMSLDKPLDDYSDNPIALSDCLQDSRISMEERTATSLTIRTEIERAMLSASLTANERTVIRLRFGLDDAHGVTLSLNAIGMRFGRSRERIRQIEARALEKLRPRLMWALRMEDEVAV